MKAYKLEITREDGVYQSWNHLKRTAIKPVLEAILKTGEDFKEVRIAQERTT